MQPEETWKDVVGYEGSYQVSDLGRVRSLDRIVFKKCAGELRKFRLKGKVLAQAPMIAYGHRVVTLYGQIRMVALVHRLVLEAFVGPCPEGMECCHFPDKNTANNRLDNLRWGTHMENMIDRDKHGSLRTGCMVRTFSKETRERMSISIRAAYERKKQQKGSV